MFDKDTCYICKDAEVGFENHHCKDCEIELCKLMADSPFGMINLTDAIVKIRETRIKEALENAIIKQR